MLVCSLCVPCRAVAVVMSKYNSAHYVHALSVIILWIASVATLWTSEIKECVLRGQKKRHCSPQWQEAALHKGEASKGERKMMSRQIGSRLSFGRRLNFYFGRQACGTLMANRIKSKGNSNIKFGNLFIVFNGGYFSYNHRQQISFQSIHCWQRSSR